MLAQMPIALRKGNLKVEGQRRKTSPTGRGERARLQPHHMTRLEDFNDLCELPKLSRQLGEKYFDYFARTIRRKIFRLLRLQHRRLHLRQLRLAMLGGSSSRAHANYRQRSGA
jgi:hypothetical protein